MFCEDIPAEEVSRALGSIQEQPEEEVEDEMEVDGMLYVKVEEGQQDCSTEEQREQSSWSVGQKSLSYKADIREASF